MMRTAPESYRSFILGPDTQHHWIVEPPRDAAGDKEAKVFTGQRAQHVALVHAYETFGCKVPPILK
jgi:hypothetical protein